MATRDSQIAIEVLRGNTDTKARDSQIAIEALIGNNDTKARVSQIAIEVLHDVVQAVVHGSTEPIWVGGAD